MDAPDGRRTSVLVVRNVDARAEKEGAKVRIIATTFVAINPARARPSRPTRRETTAFAVATSRVGIGELRLERAQGQVASRGGGTRDGRSRIVGGL